MKFPRKYLVLKTIVIWFSWPKLSTSPFKQSHLYIVRSVSKQHIQNTIFHIYARSEKIACSFCNNCAPSLMHVKFYLILKPHTKSRVTKTETRASYVNVTWTYYVFFIQKLYLAMELVAFHATPYSHSFSIFFSEIIHWIITELSFRF